MNPWSTGVRFYGSGVKRSRGFVGAMGISLDECSKTRHIVLR
jgi:hypothetical protein